MDVDERVAKIAAAPAAAEEGEALGDATPSPGVEVPTRRQSRWAFGVAIAAAAVIAIPVNAPSLRAQFGPIDDHEPLTWMGHDGKLTVGEFWNTLIHKTEVGEWGRSGRFRPAYYVARIAETAAFGDHPRAWYLCVLVQYALTCALLGYAVALWLARAVGPARKRASSIVLCGGACVATVVFAGMRSWTGIVGRLGPSEQLGLLATSVVVVALTKRALGASARWWWPAVVGVAVAAFAKESFSSLALLCPIVALHCYTARGRRRADLVAGLLGLVPPAVLAAVLGPRLLHRGSDVYGSGVGSARASGAITALTEPALRQWIPAIVLTLIAWIALSASSRRPAGTVRDFLLALIAWLVVAVLADAWFYGGNYWLPRYRAVHDLVVTLGFLGAPCLAVAASRRRPAGAVRVLAVVSIAASSAFLLRELATSISNLERTAEIAELHASQSRAYQDGINGILGLLGDEPAVPVAVVVGSVIDYEPAYAVLNELARRSLHPRAQYLLLDPTAGSGQALDAAMGEISRNGSRAWHALPVGELAGSDGALCVFLNENPHVLAGCRTGPAVGFGIRGM